MTIHSILITGCSSGIGFACATQLKQRGYRVFASARKAEDVKKLTALGLESVQLDINDAESMRRALTEITQATGGTLDALFNNAGYVQAGAIEDLDRKTHRQQFETNVFGPMELIQLVLPIMRKQGYGRIIQNSSLLGIVTLPFCGAYNASKFALEGYSLSLRQELRDTNIHVSLLNPGPVTSQLRDNAFKRYVDSLQQQPSAHKQVYMAMEESYFGPKAKDKPHYSDSPDLVVKSLLKALTSQNPKAHYYVGLPAKLLVCLHDWLPESWMEKILAQVR